MHCHRLKKSTYQPGTGPIFVLYLLFDQTKDLFRKWLMYDLGILFSMSVLSVVTAMAMELMAKIAVALSVSKITAFLGAPPRA